ncbi:MAG: hypothetical protein AAGG72_05945, partial [Pseudomonadota bacterium]
NDATTAQGLSGRDMIALLATLGIDLGLFVLAALNPPKAPPKNMQVSDEVARQVRDAIATAVSRAPEADFEWIQKHFIYHKGASYFVIPNLYSCNSEDERESSRALAVNQLAGVFDDLDLVRWPTPKELGVLSEEEQDDSRTDLTEIRRGRLAELRRRQHDKGIELDPQKAEAIEKAEPIRNHGLFSKAERMLEITGWSDDAIRDIEIYRLEDTEGLTPLLSVLNGSPGAEVTADTASA